MARRIELELTSTRDDGTWTWRTAGAKQPKGSLDGGILPSGAKVGDVLRADADFTIDGITIVAVLAPKAKKAEPDLLEIKGGGDKFEAVTTQLAPKGRGGRGDRDRGDRGPRSDRDRGPRGPRSDRDRGPGGPGGPGGPRSDRDRRDRGPRDGAKTGGGEGGRPRRSGGERAARPRNERPAPEPRPRSKRLKAGRTHRNALLAAVPESHRPITEQLLRGGIPAVRQSIERQNALLATEARPRMNAAPLLEVAESLMGHVHLAEWHDRADAALAGAQEIDLRDLRSVVVAADSVPRSDETRALADRLREALAGRVELEQREWIKEIVANLDEGRTVRALRLSSRPPKAGTPFPPDIATRLVSAISEGLTAETGAERYATVLEALALSPVRTQVTPQSVPAAPSEAIVAAVRAHAERLPQIAAAFGLSPTPS